MQTRILNLPDALKVASILHKYFPNNVEGLQVQDFALNLFSEITPDEGAVLITSLLGDAPISDPSLAIRSCVDVLIENKIVTLLETYRTIGFQ